MAVRFDKSSSRSPVIDENATTAVEANAGSSDVVGSPLESLIRRPELIAPRVTERRRKAKLQRTLSKKVGEGEEGSVVKSRAKGEENENLEGGAR